MQVEVAVEITMETTTSMQRPEKTSISSSRPLISRVLLPDSPESSTSMLYKHRETGVLSCWSASLFPVPAPSPAVSLACVTGACKAKCACLTGHTGAVCRPESCMPPDSRHVHHCLHAAASLLYGLAVIAVHSTSCVQHVMHMSTAQGRWLPSTDTRQCGVVTATRALTWWTIAELVASPSMEQRQHHGCKLKSIMQAARQNPARVFAILAGIAFVCLLGTFVAQVVLAIVCGVRILVDLCFTVPHGSTISCVSDCEHAVTAPTQ